MSIPKNISLLQYKQCFYYLIFIIVFLTTITSFASTLFYDDFESGNLSYPQWRNNNTNTGTDSGDWNLVVDPEDSTNTVLSSSPTGRTHSVNANGIDSSLRTKTLSFRFFTGATIDQYWNTRVTMLTSIWNSGEEAGVGYGIRLSGAAADNIQIVRMDGFNNAVTIATGTVTLVSGWNDVVFIWEQNGNLSANVNDVASVSVRDLDYSSAFARVYITNFLNNVTPSDTGKVILYDNIRINCGSSQQAFHDPFEDGELTSPLWRNNNANTGTETGDWSIVTDPLDTGNLVLKSSPSSRTHSINADCDDVSFGEIGVAWRFLAEDAGTSWNSQVALLLSNMNSGDEAGKGYAVKISGGTSDNLTIRRLDYFSSSTVLATGTASLNAGWNQVSFSWRSGLLRVEINGTILTAKDTNYPLKTSRIYITNFLNNIQPDQIGYVLYYDDFQLTTKTGHVPFYTAPATGVHPRILITPQELPDLRYRLSQTESGLAARGKINSWLNNSIHTSGKPLYAAYQALIAGDTGAMSLAATSWWADQMSLTLCLEAFLLWVEPDANRSADLASALETYLQIESINLNLALAYDFAYYQLDSNLQSVIRDMISAATYGEELFGSDFPAHRVSYNWIPHDMKLLLMSLAIEGETGYDSFIYESAVWLMESFLEYGIYDSGTPTEGMHYFHYGMSNGAPALAAMARRGDYLFDHPHLQANRLWYAHSIEPFGYSFSTHHDTVDAKGGLAPNYILHKWTNPDDGIFDFVWRNKIGDSSTKIDYRGDFLMYALYGYDWDGAGESPQPELDSAGVGLPVTYYCPDRGFMISRDSWSTDATTFHMECRPDVRSPSHAHSDRNGFTLSALGRRWVIDRGFHVSESKDHASVLIDDVGQGHFGPAGQIVAFEDNDDMTWMAGDSSYAYAYRYTFGTRLNNAENQGFVWEIETKPEVVAHFSDTQDPNDEPWLTIGTYPYKASYNPVQKAYRTGVLARGEYPYVVIADSIKKDEDIHTYDWLLPLEDDLVVDWSDGTSVILKEENGAADAPKLLVKVLYANGNYSLNLETYTVETSSEVMTYENFGTGKRLVITTDAVEPDFRILLLPLKDGDTVPTVSGVSSSGCTLSWQSQTDTWSFSTLNGWVVPELNRL